MAGAGAGAVVDLKAGVARASAERVFVGAISATTAGAASLATRVDVALGVGWLFAVRFSAVGASLTTAGGGGVAGGAALGLGERAGFVFATLSAD